MTTIFIKKKFFIFLALQFLFLPEYSLASNTITWDDTASYETSWVNLPFLRAKQPRNTSYNYNAYDNTSLSMLPIKKSNICRSGFFGQMATWKVESDKNEDLCYLKADFTFNCPGDSFLVGVESVFNSFKCEDGEDCLYWDRQYKFKCAFIKDKKNAQLLKTAHCNDYPLTEKEMHTKFLESNDPNTTSSDDLSKKRVSSLEKESTLACPNNYYLKGIRSIYFKPKKDRIFTTRCCKLRTLEKETVTTSSSCSVSNFPNKHSNYKSHCSKDLIINQIDLNYDGSGKKDRNIKIRCCSGDVKS